MPSRPNRRCTVHGPYRPNPLGCPQCRTQRQARIDRQRGSAAARGYDARWGKTRAAYLRVVPTCERPGCDARAVEVNHIDGLGPLGPRGHDRHNLEALCKYHHAQFTAEHQPGGWHAHGRDGGRA